MDHIGAGAKLVSGNDQIPHRMQIALGREGLGCFQSDGFQRLEAGGVGNQK